MVHDQNTTDYASPEYTSTSIAGATIREMKNRRRALAQGDAAILAQIERRRSEELRKNALFAAGLRRQAMGR